MEPNEKLLHSKENSKQNEKKKKLPLEGDKIFANDVTDKELISKMQK